jgi:hypothetical protein
MCCAMNSDMKEGEVVSEKKSSSEVKPDSPRTLETR